MNETNKLIEERIKTLPPNLKQAIDNVPWKALVQEIGKTNALDAEQIVSLEQEIMFIIYAFEPPTNFIANIAREVGVSEDAASTIAESVADKIFDPILQKSEELEKLNEKKSEPVITPTSVPEIPPSNLPMVEKGEVVHDVPHAEQPDTGPKPKIPIQPVAKPEQAKVSLPDYRYPGGQDPYRESLV